MAYSEYYTKENELEPIIFKPDALELLKKYSWKGNIRELRNFCENITVMSRSREISADMLDKKFHEQSDISIQAQASQESALPTRKESELELIKRALEAANGNKSKAAEILGISRRTLYRKIEDYFGEVK